MKKILLVILFWIIGLLVVNKASNYFIVNRTSYEISGDIDIPRRSLIMPLLNYDGRVYYDIAKYGYFDRDEFKLQAFYPLYPLTVRTLSNLTGVNIVISGLLISVVSFFLASYIFIKLITLKTNAGYAWKSFILLLLFPTSFFFISYYTESLFLLLVMLCFWFMEKNKLFAASAAAAFASATRITGLTLFPVLLYKAYIKYKSTGKIDYSVVLAPLGFISHLVYNHVAFGDFLLPLTSQQDWSRPVGISAPFLAIYNALVNLLKGPNTGYDNPYVFPVMIIEIVGIMFFAAIIYFSYKKLDMAYWIYLAGTFAIILAGGVLAASPRYIVVAFPVFLYLAQTLTGRKYVYYLLVSILLLVFLSALFFRGYWVA